MKKHPKKLIIAMAGGGTGGHVMPIRSLLETLFRTPDYASQVEKLFRFGSANSLEAETAEAFFPIPSHLPTSKQNATKIPQFYFQPILSGKLRRQKSLAAFRANLKDFILFTFWFFQSLRYLYHYHIDVVFCKGGFVALPVVFAAKLLHKKLIVHESDVHPGLVNRIASRFASAVFTGFDGVLPHSKTVGQILGDDIASFSEEGSDLEFIGDLPTIQDSPSLRKSPLPPFIKGGVPTVFIMGGSQGSRTLYETFATLLETNPLIASSFHFFISLGKLNTDLKSRFSQKNVQTFDFLTQREMGEIYAKSDICLARGGTTSLAEQKLFNIKSIIVPIPWTHDQMDNAKRYVHHYQDILFDQNSPTFLQEMEEAFLSLRSYHKPPLHRDIFTEIQQAKKLIWETILK